MTVKFKSPIAWIEGDVFFLKKEILKDKGMITKHQNFRGQIEE
jgi:hypothetical protein